jgi:hypothetical protein
MGDARPSGLGDNEILTCGTGRTTTMSVAMLEQLGSRSGDLLRARFEALVEWGCPVGDAALLATFTEIHISDAISLFQSGCPADVLISLLQ